MLFYPMFQILGHTGIMVTFNTFNNVDEILFHLGNLMVKIKKANHERNWLFLVAGTGLEPATSGL